MSATVHELTRPDTLRDRHTAFVAECQVMTALLERMKDNVPDCPSAYDRHGDRKWMLECYRDYVWAVFNKMMPVLECVADDCRDYTGARMESPDIVRGGFADFLAAIDNALDEMELAAFDRAIDGMER